MTQHAMKIPQGILHYSSVDLEFEFEGKHTYMEFHHYCGPSFYTMKTVEDKYGSWEEEVWIYPDDSEQYDTLWEEFYKWFNAAEQKHLHFKGEE